MAGVGSVVSSMAGVGSLVSSMAGISLGSGFASSSGIMGSNHPGMIAVQAFPSGKTSNGIPRPQTITMTIRKWELKKLVEKKKMHVRLGDTVKVISGSDKGKVGEVTKLYRKWSKIIVKDVNMVTKHVKPKEKGESGQIIKMEAPLHSSNVQLYSTTMNVVSRVGHKVLEDGTKVRYLIKTGEVVDTLERWQKLRFREKDGKKNEEDKNKPDENQQQ